MDVGDAKVQMPSKRTELRIMELDDSVTPEDITRVLAAEGGCQPGHIKVRHSQPQWLALGHSSQRRKSPKEEK